MGHRLIVSAAWTLGILSTVFTAPARADMNQPWRDYGPIVHFGTRGGQDTDMQYYVDSQLIIRGTNGTVHKGDVLAFDYKETYFAKSLRGDIVTGLPFGQAEMVPGNLFPTETAPGWSQPLDGKHFEHDLYTYGCLDFKSLDSVTLQTNSPAAGGINNLMIGPVAIGASVPGLGDTKYDAHLTADKAFVDWVTGSSQAGFFFTGGSIDFKGSVIVTKATGTGSLAFDNKMWESAHTTFYPPFIIRNERNWDSYNVKHSIALTAVSPNPTPEPSSLVLGSLGGCLGLLATRRWRRRER
jgi:hypothetical protein